MEEQPCGVEELHEAHFHTGAHFCPGVHAPQHLPTAEDIANAIQLAKDEIQADIVAGVLPADVPDFSALHNYVDANCYGGLCDGWRTGIDWLAEEDHLDSANAVADAVDAWLVAGRP